MLISKDAQRPLQIGCLLLFAVLSLSINFLHSETSAASQANCPACHFLASNLSVGPALFFVLPLLIALGAVCVDPPCRFCETGVCLFLSRSPPTD